MAQDPYGLLASGVDPETSIEMQKLMRQQKVAEAMGQSAMQPLQGQMVGNVYVAPSLTQGLAKLAQGYLSRKDQDATDASMRGLSQRYQQGQSDAMQRVIGAMTGAPESATGQMYPAGGNPDEQGGMGYQPAVPGGIDQAISVAGQSPYTRKIAEALMETKIKQAMPKQKMIVPAGSVVLDADNKPVFTAPNKPQYESATPLSRLISERDELPAGDPRRKTYDNAIRKESEIAKQIVPPVTITGNLEKPMTAAQKMKFDKQISDDFKSTGQVMQSMKQIEGAISDITSSKGLSAREGLTGYIPAVFQGEDARIAQNRIDTLKGKVTQMGKAMASMSGAIGPMAVQEWKIVADAVNALDPTAGNFKEQLSNVEAQALGASGRVKDWYDRKYATEFEKYPQFKTEDIPLFPIGGGRESSGRIATPSPSSLSVQEQAELDALRKRFGK